MMRLASYIASKGTIIDRLIALRHWGRYSHNELVFSDGMSFSSSPRDGGVRFKRIDFNPNHWDFVYFSLPPEEERDIREWAENLAKTKAKYDWSGLFSFVNPFSTQKIMDWFCTEVCIAAMQVKSYFAKFNAWKIWPTRCHRMFQEQFNEFYR